MQRTEKAFHLFFILGQSYWSDSGETCLGKYESPIESHSLAVKHIQLPPLKFSDLNSTIYQIKIENDGNTGESNRFINFSFSLDPLWCLKMSQTV